MATVGSPLREVAANTAAPSPARKHARSDGAPADGGGGVDKDARISELEAEVERLKKRLKTAEQRGAGGGGASLKGRLPRRLGGRAINVNAPRASRRLMPEKCGGVDAVAGSSMVPGQSNWTTRP